MILHKFVHFVSKEGKRGCGEQGKYTILEQNMLGCIHFGISLYILYFHSDTCTLHVFHVFYRWFYIWIVHILYTWKTRILIVISHMDLYVFDTCSYTLKSHIPQKEDRGGLMNTKICIFKAKYTAGDSLR